MNTQPILEAESLRKKYQDAEAVSGVSFVVRHGEIVGLLGPNGAGKTTIINMLLGVLKPNSGTIRIGGKDLAKLRTEALMETNFAAVYAQVPGNLTVYQNLYVFSLIYGVPEPGERVSRLIREFDLERFRNEKCGVLSSGEQTRVALAKSMINSPRLLLLDEPTASLDPSTAQTIRNKIKDFARNGNGGVLWTSHNMYEVEEVCDRVLFLSHGKILLEGNPRELPRENGKENLEQLFVTVAREQLSLKS